jgi:hypothetical protein
VDLGDANERLGHVRAVGRILEVRDDAHER